MPLYYKINSVCTTTLKVFKLCMSDVTAKHDHDGVQLVARCLGRKSALIMLLVLVRILKKP